MKKNKYKAKPVSKRSEWKDETENEIILMQEEMDELADELGLSEETILKLEKIVDKFKGRMNDAIDLFTVTPEIAIESDDFTELFLDEMYYDRIVPGESDIRRMCEIVTDSKNGGGVFIKYESLAHQMTVEGFLESISDNPYQLKLIA